MLRPALERAIEAGILPEGIDPNYAAAMLVGAYFTFRLAIDSDKWPDDMPENLLASLGIVKP